MRIPFSKEFLSAVFVCLLFPPGLPAQASVPDETTTITLDQPVHFLGTDGSDVVANPGKYSVEAAQEWLRLIPGTERRDALLIEAQKGTHEVKVEIPIVLSTPGDEPDDPYTLKAELIPDPQYIFFKKSKSFCCPCNVQGIKIIMTKYIMYSQVMIAIVKL